jgi:hypothetical protein
MFMRIIVTAKSSKKTCINLYAITKSRMQSMYQNFYNTSPYISVPHRRNTASSLYSVTSLANLSDLILSLAAIEWLFIPPPKIALVASLRSTSASSGTLPLSLDETVDQRGKDRLFCQRVCRRSSPSQWVSEE